MATQQQPAGWYPDPQVAGQQRYWDGTRWTEQTAPAAAPAAAVDPYQQSRQLAMFAHLSAILTGFLGPLIFYLVKKDEDPFVADQSREALNFNLSLLIYSIPAWILAFVTFGILVILPIGLWVAALVLWIIAGVQANNGQWYRYPLTIRMVN